MFMCCRNLRIRLCICTKFMIKVLICYVLEIVVIFSFYDSGPLLDLHQCYGDDSAGIITDRWHNESTPLEDVLLSNTKPLPGRAIFFIETGCRSPDSDLKYSINLTARQICSIESAARNNPNLQVFVLFASPKVLDRNNPIVRITQIYKNVHLRQLNIWRYAKDTPIEDWVIKDNRFLSRYSTEQTSDLLRLLTLYRFGGIYMDLDVVVLRSLEQVPLNYAGARIMNVVSNAVVSLEPTGTGHEIAELFLRDFQQNFNGADYAFNGPQLVERVLVRVCGTKSVKEMINNPKRCHGFRVFDASAFYILQDLPLLFDSKRLEKALEMSKNSYLIHLWNRNTKHCRLRKGSSSAYGTYAQQHCPEAYGAAGVFF